MITEKITMLCNYVTVLKSVAVAFHPTNYWRTTLQSVVVAIVVGAVDVRPLWVACFSRIQQFHGRFHFDGFL